MLKTDVVETSRKRHLVDVTRGLYQDVLRPFFETIKHLRANFLVISFNTIDEVTLAKYYSNPFYTDAGI